MQVTRSPIDQQHFQYFSQALNTATQHTARRSMNIEDAISVGSSDEGDEDREVAALMLGARAAPTSHRSKNPGRERKPISLCNQTNESTTGRHEDDDFEENAPVSCPRRADLTLLRHLQQNPALVVDAALQRLASTSTSNGNTLPATGLHDADQTIRVPRPRVDLTLHRHALANASSAPEQLRNACPQRGSLLEAPEHEDLEEKEPVSQAQAHMQHPVAADTSLPQSPPTKKRAIERPSPSPSNKLALRPAGSPTRGPICAPHFAAAPWPNHVAHLAANFNPDGITVPFVAEDGKCSCVLPCRHESCRNAGKSIFCTPSCCEHGDKCGNRLTSSNHVVLFQDVRSNSLGLVATKTIPKGVTIGEYLGRLTLDRPSKDRVRNRGYRMLMNVKPKDSGKWRVCIDAEHFGSLMRFANHSCAPSAAFLERSNASKHTIVVATLREVRAGQEITVNYGKELWFVCRCGRKRCIHSHIQDQSDP